MIRVLPLLCYWNYTSVKIFNLIEFIVASCVVHVCNPLLQ